MRSRELREDLQFEVTAFTAQRFFLLGGQARQLVVAVAAQAQVRNPGYVLELSTDLGK